MISISSVKFELFSFQEKITLFWRLHVDDYFLENVVIVQLDVCFLHPLPPPPFPALSLLFTLPQVPMGPIL